MGISLKKEYFEQESIMLRDSTEFIFHFDCLKDAIKKHLPVGSDGNGMGTGVSGSYFLIKKSKKKCFKGVIG